MRDLIACALVGGCILFMLASGGAYECGYITLAACALRCAVAAVAGGVGVALFER